MCLWIGSFDALTYATKSLMPPSYLNSTVAPPARSSTSLMWKLRVRDVVSGRCCVLGPDGGLVVGVQGHPDALVAARERLVDGVRNHLVDEVVKTARTGRADVHAGPFPDRFEAFKDRDVLCGVACFGHREKALQMPA